MPGTIVMKTVTSDMAPKMDTSAAFSEIAFDERARLQMALDISDAVIYEWSLVDDRIQWDDRIHAMLPTNDPEHLQTGEGFKSFLDERGVKLRSSLAKGDSASLSSFQIEYQFRMASDELCWVEDRGRRVVNQNGEVECIIGVLRIITQHKLREQRLNYLASYDDLTGLLNRTRLREKLDQTIYTCTQENQSGAYLVAGIDALAAVNSDYGFDIADEVIAGVGERLRETAGPDATIGRVAGSKFGIIIDTCDEDAIAAKAQEFVDGVHISVIDTSSSPIASTISIGGVALPFAAENSAMAMARAEQALDIAKHTGRSAISIYETSHDKGTVRKHNAQVGDQIVSALNERRVKLAYQPIVSAETLDVREYECLIRLIDREGKVWSAGEFVPHAERLGLIRLLDRRVLELAVDVLQDRPNLRFAINVSGVTATEAVGLEGYLRHIEANRNVADRMTIELTETSNLRNLEESVRFLSRLRDLGCRIAIDDFGAGYTSFRNLQALVVDSVKIDGAFIRGLATNQDNQVFVRTLLELAQNFGLETVAEWVGDEEEVELLRQYGVDYLQGFYLGEPVMALPEKDCAMDLAYNRKRSIA